jgi:hypothetical protein
LVLNNRIYVFHDDQWIDVVFGPNNFDVPLGKISLFQGTGQQNVWNCAVLYSQKHYGITRVNIDSFNQRINLLLYGWLGSNRLAVLFALFDLRFNGVKWIFFGSLFGKCDSGRQINISNHPHRAFASDTIFWVFQEQGRLASLDWLA